MKKLVLSLFVFAALLFTAACATALAEDNPMNSGYKNLISTYKPVERCDFILPATQYRQELVFKNAGILFRGKCIITDDTPKKDPTEEVVEIVSELPVEPPVVEPNCTTTVIPHSMWVFGQHSDPGCHDLHYGWFKYYWNTTVTTCVE